MLHITNIKKYLSKKYKSLDKLLKKNRMNKIAKQFL